MGICLCIKLAGVNDDLFKYDAVFHVDRDLVKKIRIAKKYVHSREFPCKKKCMVTVQKSKICSIDVFGWNFNPNIYIYFKKIYV